MNRHCERNEDVGGEITRKVAAARHRYHADVVVAVTQEVESSWRNKRKSTSVKEYLRKLDEDYREEPFDIEETLSAVKILQEDVQAAIPQLKESKTPSPDNIQTELIILQQYLRYRRSSNRMAKI
ncbi:hypothetical protein Trydic_g19741 [Trypoxylus dichotomus]